MIRDKDGFYTFCGRSDDMIKVAGKFASPKEVEDCLMTYEYIDECAVVGRPDTSGLMKLFAFITLRNASLDQLGETRPHDDEITSELSVLLQSQLDSYKLPKSITVLKAFPKTHLGKINRGAL